jgi:hypothetical protein
MCRDSAREELESYSRSIKVMLAVHEKKLFKNQLQRKKLLKTMSEEVRKWKKWGLVKLESCAK